MAADFEQVKQNITDTIYENGEELITGQVMQDRLLEMVSVTEEAINDVTIDPTVNVTVNNTTGTPSGSASFQNNQFSFEFSGIKGETGNSGYTGAVGELEVVNNLNSDDATAALSAYQGKVLDEKIGQTVKTVEQTISDEKKGIARNNIDFESAIYGEWGNYLKDVLINGVYALETRDGWRVTDFIPYTPGTQLVWRFGYGAVAFSAFLVFYNSDRMSVNFLSANGFTNSRSGNWNVVGASFIRASYYKTINGEDNICPITIGGIDWYEKDSVEGINKETLDYSRCWKPLPLGKLINCDTTSGELTHNTTYDPIRVTGGSILCLPSPMLKVRLRTPKDLGYTLSCFFWYGGSDGVINQSSGTALWNNEVITFPATAKAFRIVFRGATGATTGIYYKVPISASDIQQMIDSGELAIEYEDTSELGTMERNLSLLPQVTAAKRVLNLQDLSGDGFEGTAVFAHISDLHGDAMRFRNCMEYCDSIGGVDAVLNSGDSTLYDHPDGTSWLLQIGSRFDTKMLFCIGNHESLPTGQSALFADNIEALAQHYGYMEDTSVQTTHCYYFKDFAQKKVRVIVLNYYENGVYNGRIGQNQITWFVNILKGTPAGYGVMVMLHSPEDKVVAPSGVDSFMQPSPKYGDTYQPNGFYVGNRPIMQIIDAFIGRATLSTTYSDHSATYNGGSDTSTESVSINADFRNVASGVEFIAYVCGHRHEDNTGYYSHSQSRQLCLDITCGIGLYGDASNEAWANQSDLPRYGAGVTQDAFNIYGIDRVNGCVKIARVGATITTKMVERKFLSIPYK